jgi:DNA-binding transcriptional ArsR family regulator
MVPASLSRAVGRGSAEPLRVNQRNRVDAVTAITGSRERRPALRWQSADHPAIEHLAEYFKVFSEPNRLAVLEALRNGPLNVSAVVDKTGLSQALVSKHLKLLTIAGVVQRRPQGSLVFYEVNNKAVFKLIAQAEKLMLASRRQQLDALAAIL